MRRVWTAAYCAFVVMCLISVSAASQESVGADPLGGWGDAEFIEYMEAGDADRPVVSADALGNAIVVWEQWDGYRHSIWSNRYVYLEGWGPAERLDSTMVENALTPHVDTDGSGNAVAVWQQYDGVRYNIWSNRYVVGEGWGTPQTIETHSEDAGLAQGGVDRRPGDAVSLVRDVDPAADGEIVLARPGQLVLLGPDDGQRRVHAHDALRHVEGEAEVDAFGRAGLFLVHHVQQIDMVQPVDHA